MNFKKYMTKLKKKPLIALFLSIMLLVGVFASHRFIYGLFALLINIESDLIQNAIIILIVIFIFWLFSIDFKKLLNLKKV